MSFNTTLVPPPFLQILPALPFLGLFQEQCEKPLSQLQQNPAGLLGQPKLERITETGGYTETTSPKPTC